MFFEVGKVGEAQAAADGGEVKFDVVSMRDMDAVLAVRVSPEVEMTVCCGLSLKETDKAKRDTLYSDAYFGLNFDI